VIFRLLLFGMFDIDNRGKKDAMQTFPIRIKANKRLTKTVER